MTNFDEQIFAVLWDKYTTPEGTEILGNSVSYIAQHLGIGNRRLENYIYDSSIFTSIEDCKGRRGNKAVVITVA